MFTLETLICRLQFYIRLGNNGGVPGVPADTATLAGITEVSGTGYVAQLVSRNTADWSAPVLDVGDYETESKVVTFQNTGVAAWSAADFAYLSTTSDNTGLLISSVPFKHQQGNSSRKWAIGFNQTKRQVRSI